MMRESWFIARKDAWHMLRERETLVWLFVMPVVFIYFVGAITGGSSFGPRSATDVLAIWAAPDEGYLLERLIKRLEENNYKAVRPQTREAFEAHARRLTVPEGFTESVLNGRRVVVRFENKNSGAAGDYDRVRVGRAVYTVLADVIAARESGAAPAAEYFRRLDSMPRKLALDVRAAGKRQKIPSGYDQSAPGVMVMFTLLVLLTTGAVTLVIERRQGLLRRLAATPISSGAIVSGKWASRLILGMVQVAFALAAGALLFKVDWGPSLPTVLLVLAGWSALCASAGMLLGNLVKSEGQAIGIGVLSANLLAAFGGCWWPVEITPRWMQALAGALPTGWAMDALHQLVNFQAGAGSAVSHVLLLFGTSIVITWLAARTFRYQ